MKACLLLILALTVPKIWAADSVRFPSTQQIADATLQRCGVAELKAYRLFTVGAAALYRENCATSWRQDTQESRVMLFRYARNIPAHAFTESAETLLRRNQSLPENASALRQFHSSYRDVSDGDQYRLEYQANDGLRLLLNDQELARLREEPLAHAYFNIWLGRRPFDESLKQRLLGLD
ncbi:chalcone isomerase family protein [Hahella sp. HN01]|uniref:chalcone isomerase family protein n=1 Tax=Hahella sp. HN01 TaxID=2847262 RepID=UPI001C1ECFC9|nr:chalcone isomerase family protein [Hahella sp. HN01]